MKMMYPKVTVVIIFLNQEKYLAEAVASVFDQSRQDWELLLVDDGSTDRSTTMAREYETRFAGQVKYLEHPEHANLGMSGARNLGLAHARGEYIAFLDADDIWPADKLERQVKILDQWPEAVLTFGRLHFFTDEPDIPIPEGLVPLRVPAGLLHPPTVFRQSLVGPGGMLWTPSNILFRKKCLLDVGGFETPFRGLGEDAVVWLKINLTHSVYALDELTLHYRRHGGASGIIDWRNRALTSGWLKVITWLNSYVQDQPASVRQWAMPIVNDALFKSVKDEAHATVTAPAKSFAQRCAAVGHLWVKVLRHPEVTVGRRVVNLCGLTLVGIRSVLRIRTRAKKFWRVFAT
jgi:glycosyltransferase involved in cell wall biosynthesis